MRKGSTVISAPFLTDGPITLAKLRAWLAGAVARVDPEAIGNDEMSDMSFAKLITGILTGNKVLTFSGAGVIAKSANFSRGEQRFVCPLVSDLSKTINVPGAKFTVADVGGRVQGKLIPAGTTIESRTDDDHVVLSVFPSGPSVDVPLYFPDRSAGGGWALYGDGKLEINFGGVFRGIIELAGFSVGADGTVTIGAGDFKLTANPDGSFTWGSGGKVVGITPNGELFAGGTDYASAVFSVNSAGDVLMRETSQSMHSIPPGAIDWDAILAPTFDPPGGAFDTSVDVAILCQTPRVKIYYTTDGSTPTSGSTLYTGARIHLTATTTLKAIAYIGPFASTVSSQTFTSDAAVAPNPQADPVGGDYSPVGGILAVDVADSLAGASIRYTLDGSTPSDVAGTLISPPNGVTPPGATINVNTGTKTLKMIAFKAGKTNSAVVTEIYTVTNGGASGGGFGGGGRGNLP